jgi:hypothetical protein
MAEAIYIPINPPPIIVTFFTSGFLTASLMPR